MFKNRSIEKSPDRICRHWDLAWCKLGIPCLGTLAWIFHHTGTYLRTE